MEDLALDFKATEEEKEIDLRQIAANLRKTSDDALELLDKYEQHLRETGQLEEDEEG